MALFSGDFLEGFSLRDSPDFDDWQIGEADALERELASALRRLVELLAARGEYEQAIPHARRWLELDPLHEPAHRELIRLYAWSGDRAAALEQYRRLRSNAEPGARGGAARGDRDPLRAGERREPGPSAARREARAPRRAPAAPPPGAPPELPLVGRADELAALVDAHARAQPDGGLAVIEGEAGIGKTRLARRARAERAEPAGRWCSPPAATTTRPASRTDRSSSCCARP